MSSLRNNISLELNEITEYISNLILENADSPSLSSDSRGFSFEFLVPSTEVATADSFKHNIELGDSFHWT